MGRLIGTSPFFKPGPPAQVGHGSESVTAFLLEQAEGTVLDLGGGRGAYAYELMKRGADVTVGEIDPVCLQAAAEAGMKTLDLTRTEWSALKDGFDTVAMFDVLEHIPDYEAFLGHALACARKKIVLTVPCNDDFEELFRVNLTYNHIAVSDHINQFTSGDMRALLERTGLEFEIRKGDFLLRSSIVPLVYGKLRRNPIGFFLAVPLKLLCVLGWVPDRFPSRLFVMIKKQ